MASISPISFIKPLDASQAVDQYSLGQKQALIDALKQSAINPPAPQNYGAIATRSSAITPIVQAISAMLAKSKQDSLNESVKGLYQNQYSQLQGMMGGGQPQANGSAQPTQDMMGSLKAADAQGIAPDQAPPIQAPQMTPQASPQPMQQPNPPNALGRIVQALTGNKPVQTPIQAPPVQPGQSGQSQMNPFGMDPSLAANAYLQDSKGYTDKLIDFYAKKAAPVDSQHTIEGMIFNPRSGKYSDADGQPLTDAEVQARLHSSAGFQHSAEGLVFDPRSGKYTNADGKQLTAKEVQEQIAATSGARAQANTKGRVDATNATGSSLTPEAIEFNAKRLLNGEKPRDVLANFGRGTQGAADLRAVQNKYVELAGQAGVAPEDMAGKVQELAAEGRTRLELGAREGKIAPRVQEAQDFAKLARDRSEAIPRSNWTDANKAIQYADAHLSDPKLAAFNAANISLINAYAAAIGGGTVHVHDQEVGQKMLSTAAGPEGYKAAVDQIIRETQTALGAPAKVMDDLRAKDKASHASGPKAGDIEQGHRFKGGNPADPNSWEKV